MAISTPVIVEGQYCASKKEAAKLIHSKLENYPYGYKGIYRELQNHVGSWSGEVRGMKVQILAYIYKEDR